MIWLWMRFVGHASKFFTGLTKDHRAIKWHIRCLQPIDQRGFKSKLLDDFFVPFIQVPGFASIHYLYLRKNQGHSCAGTKSKTVSTIQSPLKSTMSQVPPVRSEESNEESNAYMSVAALELHERNLFPGLAITRPGLMHNTSRHI